MNKNNKRGFTIVELVIVIAIIAILAAVLIPTFANVIKRANESADIQAVRQMNTYLAINEITEGKTIIDVYDALEKGCMTAKNYKPLTSDTYFFWDSTLNRVLYTDDQYNVTFPEEYTTATKTNGWYSLSGTIPTKEVAIANGEVNVSSAEELFYVVNQAKTTSVSKITLTDDIDVMGASISFDKITEIDGGNHKLIGFNNLKATTTHGTSSGETEKYVCGLVSSINGSDAVTIKDLTIENAVVGSMDTGNVGILVGQTDGVGSASLTVKNVIIKNCSVYGKQKVGTLVGFFRGGTIAIENTNVENVNIYTAQGEAGKILGSTQNTVTLDLKDYTETPTGNGNETTFSNVTVNLMPITASWPMVDLSDTLTVTQNAHTFSFSNVDALVMCDENNQPDSNQGYRIFASQAWLSAHSGTCSSLTIKIGETTYQPFANNWNENGSAAVNDNNYTIGKKSIPVMDLTGSTGN